MSYVTWKIDHIPYVDNTWDSGSETTLSYYFDPLLKVALGANRDTFQFRVNNLGSTYTDFFNPNDKVTISRVLNSTTVSTSDIILIGTIKNNPTEENFAKNFIRVEGFNYSETVMSALTFIDATNLTIPAGIKLALEQVAGANANFGVTWDEGNPLFITNPVTGATSDFPLIGERFFNKPIKDIIEKYSTSERTTNGNYYWYVNNENKLIWRQGDSYTSDDFNAGTDNYKRIKIGKDIKGVRNDFIIKGGLDPAGNQIQIRATNWSSIGKHGYKYQLIVSENNNAQELVKDDLGDTEDKTIRWPSGLSDAGDGFTTTWNATITAVVDGITMTAGSPVIINKGGESANRNAYTAVIREEVRARLTREGERVKTLFANGKLKVDIDFIAGSKEWVLGNKINSTIPEIGSDPITLRIQEIQYGHTLDTYSLEEDTGTQ